MKKMWVCGLAAVMTVVMTVPAFAGGWKQDLSRPASQDGTSGWWYQNDDGDISGQRLVLAGWRSERRGGELPV